MQFELERVARAELVSGERLLWAGQPQRGLRLRRSDAALIPFSLLWGGFALWWTHNAWTMEAPIFFLVVGAAFSLMGLNLIFGRFLIDAWKRAHTIYALSDQRALIITQRPKRETRSFTITGLNELAIVEGRDGSGTITLGPGAIGPRWLQGTSWPGLSQDAAAFEMIPDARRVHELIRSTQRDRLALGA